MQAEIYQGSEVGWLKESDLLILQIVYEETFPVNSDISIEIHGQENADFND